MGMFDKLSPEEREWRNRLAEDLPGRLSESIQAKNIDRVAFALKKSDFAAVECNAFALQIVRQDSADMLTMFFNRYPVKKLQGLNFNPEAFMENLFHEAASHKCEMSWDFLYAYNAQDSKVFTPNERHFFIQHEWMEKLVPVILDDLKWADKYTSSRNSFTTLGKDIIKSGSDSVFQALWNAIIDKNFSGAGIFDHWFEDACILGKADRVRAMVAYGVNPAGRNNAYAPFLAAAENGHLDVIQVLAQGGMDVYDPECFKKWQFKVEAGKISAETDEYIRGLEWGQKSEPAVTAPVHVNSAAPIETVSADMDIYKQEVSLSESSSITTVFNFVSQQQIVIVREASPPLMTTTIVPFRDMDAGIIIAIEEKLMAENRRSDINRNTSFLKK